jgi:DMSO/TMAO reductase YedYZ molybdopterin-dependent catalytic subunit
MKPTNIKALSLVAGSVLFAQAATQTAIPTISMADEPDRLANISATDPVTQAEYPQLVVQVPDILGAFQYDQGVKLANHDLARCIYGISDHICVSTEPETQPQAVAADEDISSIKVSGDVMNPHLASIAELEKKAPIKKIMGCTCANNPVDGRASANAEVSGFMLKELINDAMVHEGVNTISFISQDGYRISLPLNYVTQRYSIIVTHINGEKTADVAGYSNQLWLGSTSARSFIHDIVAIELTAEADPPAPPGALGTANLPNVGILNGR